MALRSHNIQLASLREGEEVLHNCSQQAMLHLKIPMMYVTSILVGFGILILATSFFADTPVVWFLFSCYALIATTYFFIRNINSEMSGCVITNQRILRFGYKGLSQITEREILPKNIEDFKVERKGIFSIISDAAFVHIYTANNQVEVLKNVVQADKIQNAYSEMVKSDERKRFADRSESTEENTITQYDAITQVEEIEGEEIENRGNEASGQ